MMNEKKHGIGHNIRQAVLVTVVLLVLCGLVFPVLLSGLSAVIFPSQAKGSLVTLSAVCICSTVLVLPLALAFGYL